MDLNLDRPLGPRVPVTSPEVLRRLTGFLGAMPEALREYDSLRLHEGAVADLHWNIRVSHLLKKKDRADFS